MWDMRWTPKSEYEMCSETTQDIAAQLLNYRNGGSVSMTMYMLYPLLYDIPDWMDEQYDC